MTPTAAAAPRPAVPTPAPTRERLPRLTVVPRPGAGRMRRGPFVLLVVVLLGAGLMVLLMLNTVLAQDAFVAHDLEDKVAVLTDREQALAQQVAAEEAPGRLEARAERLGMVPYTSPAFLRLSDGKVLGAPSPAPTPTPTPQREHRAQAPAATVAGQAGR